MNEEIPVKKLRAFEPLRPEILQRTHPEYGFFGPLHGAFHTAARHSADPLRTKQHGIAVSFSAVPHATSFPDLRAQKSVWEDWSGRGSHVDYKWQENIPLKRGRHLGSGINGAVYETTCKGVNLAWKRKFCRSEIDPEERSEIEILKRLSHKHIVSLVGTYTHRNYLGLLLWPVAICDLATFFEDLELLHHRERREKWEGEKHVILERMRALGLEDVNSQERPPGAIKRLRQVFGCLASAMEYLHSEQIRHKDLKPSNILLARESMWVADFSTSTDFSILSASGTANGERGTPKYFAPEVAAYEKNGRLADIFSLGCVYLEMLYLCQGGCHDTLKSLRPAKDHSFQANLDLQGGWLAALNPRLGDSVADGHLMLLIRQMLQRQPSQRPTASEVVSHISLASKLNFEAAGTPSKYHGSCCDPGEEEQVQRQIEEIEQLQRLEEEREIAYQENKQKEKEDEIKARENVLLDQYYKIAERHAEEAEDARLHPHGESEESRLERLTMFASLKQTIPSTEDTMPSFESSFRRFYLAEKARILDCRKRTGVSGVP